MKRPDTQRGQVLPLVALALTLLFGFAALAVDAGYLQYRQRVQQTASDAAGISGAWALVAGGSASSAGVSAATTNGFTDNGTTVRVSVTAPPASGPNSANNSAVEAIVTASYPALFSSVLGRTQNTVSTRAVAVVQNGETGPCIYVLNGDMNFDNGNLSGPCGALVSGNVQGNNKTVWNIPSLGAGGHITGNPPSSVDATAGIPPFNDPCQTIPGCKALTAMYPFGSNVATEGQFKNACTKDPGSGSTLVHGCYNSLSGTYTVGPGLYVIPGDLTGSLSCPSCGSTTGVTLVVGGKVNLNGSTTNLTAPPAAQGAVTATVDSGGAPGMVLYQADTTTSPENFSAQLLDGVVYAPGAHVNMNAASSLTVGTLIVEDFVSNGNTITVRNGGPKNPVQSVILSE